MTSEAGDAERVLTGEKFAEKPPVKRPFKLPHCGTQKIE